MTYTRALNGADLLQIARNVGLREVMFNVSAERATPLLQGFFAEAMATLRQQAGRVDVIGELEPLLRELERASPPGVLFQQLTLLGEFAAASRRLIAAALAQNTQGEAVVGYITADNLALLKQDDGSAFGHSTAPIYSRARSEREIPLYAGHAERARVPDADAARFRYIVEFNWIGTKTRCAERIQDSDLESARRAVDRALAAAPSQRAEVK